MADYDGMNQVWDAWLADAHAPVRVCVESPMAKKHYRIEVQVIAALMERPLLLTGSFVRKQ
ncbi:enamine deaminase RidA (YjgF/YER057c/UK114 family) [Pseudomonas sp. TE12234]